MSQKKRRHSKKVFAGLPVLIPGVPTVGLLALAAGAAAYFLTRPGAPFGPKGDFEDHGVVVPGVSYIGGGVNNLGVPTSPASTLSAKPIVTTASAGPTAVNQTLATARAGWMASLVT